MCCACGRGRGCTLGGVSMCACVCSGLRLKPQVFWDGSTAYLLKYILPIEPSDLLSECCILQEGTMPTEHVCLSALGI